MNKKIGVGFFFLLMIFILSYYSESQAESISLVIGEIRSPEKRISIVGNYAFIEGRWKRAQGSTKYTKMTTINTVSITCDRKTMTCTETIAKLVTPKEEPWIGDPLLFIDTTTYQIIDWSDDTIYAKYPAPVADFELRISIKDKFAERRRRETKARGAETSDPNIFENCILE